jgi:molybdate/tungstate transport system substrate-binding protein
MNHDKLQVLYAGSLQDLVTRELFPCFAHLTGYQCIGRAGGSREWARQLRLGEVEADLLLSADSSVNELELMRPGEAAAEWYLTFATNELVLAYGEASPAYVQIHAAAQEEDGWLRLLRLGLRLGRPDPEVDPKGYRTLFALQLAEIHLGLTGLADQVAGPARNPEQLYDAAELLPMLTRGELDLMFCYRSQAEEAGVPFISLPEEINLGSPNHAERYATASYQCDDGTLYRGAPIAYTATPIARTQHPLPTSAFLVFLASDEAAEAIVRRGFRPARGLVRPR